LATTNETLSDTAAHGRATITVTVNNRDVALHQHSATGAQIKAAAIEQGVSIQADFSLFQVREAGKMTLIRDDETITLHEREAFRAVAPDDSSRGY